ncbi:MAG: hypothetical protein P0Y51_15500 [Candidatus Pseudomonas colombiensis]|nr:MAG: hypothetical protein P0Y51_15500 [Pseudomonas sp.]
MAGPLTKEKFAWQSLAQQTVQPPHFGDLGRKVLTGVGNAALIGHTRA